MVDAVVRTLASWGPGVLMTKVDIEEAYWLIPTHPEDHPLLAVQWKLMFIVKVHCHLDSGWRLRYLIPLPIRWSGVPRNKELHQ